MRLYTKILYTRTLDEDTWVLVLSTALIAMAGLFLRMLFGR